MYTHVYQTVKIRFKLSKLTIVVYMLLILTKRQTRTGLLFIQYSRIIPEPRLTGITGQAKLLYGGYTGNVTC